MPSPGGVRRGTRFENACQDLFESLGYTAIFENEEFQCKHPEKHKTDRHEIDLLLKYETNLFLKPWCSATRPLIECTTSLKKPTTTKERRQLAKSLILDRIECVREYGYSPTCGIITTNSTLQGMSKLANNVFVWDQPRMTFYAYKIFESKKMDSNMFSVKERKINDEASFLWAVQKHEKKEHYLHNVAVFFDKTIRSGQATQVNTTDLNSAIRHIKGEIINRKLHSATVYADLFAISGFTRSIHERKDALGTNYSTGKISVAIERILDVEITPWWALIR